MKKTYTDYNGRLKHHLGTQQISWCHYRPKWLTTGTHNWIWIKYILNSNRVTKGLKNTKESTLNDPQKNSNRTKKCPFPTRVGFTKPGWYIISALGDTFQYRMTFIKKEGGIFRVWVILLLRACNTSRVSYDISSMGVWYYEVSHNTTPRAMRHF